MNALVCDLQYCSCRKDFYYPPDDYEPDPFLPYLGEGAVAAECDPRVSESCPLPADGTYETSYEGSGGGFDEESFYTEFEDEWTRGAIERLGESEWSDGQPSVAPMGIGVSIKSNRYWPNGKVLYWFDVANLDKADGFTSKEVRQMESTISEFNSLYGNHAFFLKVPANTPRSIRIFKVKAPESCMARVGYQKDGQGFIQLKSNCIEHDVGRRSAGGMVHEMLHAIGFSHEHQRADRNKSICVADGRDTRWIAPGGGAAKYIQPGYLDQFDIKDVDSYQLFTPYDLASLMHYGDTSGCIKAVPGGPVWIGTDFKTNCVNPTMVRYTRRTCPIPTVSAAGIQGAGTWLTPKDEDALKQMYASSKFFVTRSTGKDGVKHFNTSQTRAHALTNCAERRTARGDTYRLPLASEMTEDFRKKLIRFSTTSVRCVWLQDQLTVLDASAKRLKVRDRLFYWSDPARRLPDPRKDFYDVPEGTKVSNPACLRLCVRP